MKPPPRSATVATEFADPWFAAGAMRILYFNSEPRLILEAVNAIRQED
jgi:hypothetical protein